MLSALLRAVGLRALAYAGSRLSYGWGWLMGVVVMVVANLGPILTLLEGRWGVADVVLFYAIENCLLVATTTVRLLTYAGPGAAPPGRPWLTGSPWAALSFGLFAGIFTLAGTILVIVFSALHGYQGSWVSWVVNGVLLVLAYPVALAVLWFGQGQRTRVTSPLRMSLAAVPRVVNLHLLCILVPALNGFDERLPVIFVVCVAIKIAFDLGLMIADLVVHRRGGAR